MGLDHQTEQRMRELFGGRRCCECGAAAARLMEDRFYCHPHFLAARRGQRRTTRAQKRPWQIPQAEENAPAQGVSAPPSPGAAPPDALQPHGSGELPPASVSRCEHQEGDIPLPRQDGSGDVLGQPGSEESLPVHRLPTDPREQSRHAG
jgi:hypothetical protein